MESIQEMLAKTWRSLAKEQTGQVEPMVGNRLVSFRTKSPQGKAMTGLLTGEEHEGLSGGKVSR